MIKELVKVLKRKNVIVNGRCRKVIKPTELIKHFFIKTWLQIISE